MTSIEQPILILYRYWKTCIEEELEYGNTSNVRIFVEEFYVRKETPQGYWYSQKGSMKQRWTSKTARRRYAYPTKEEALQNFIYRQKTSISLGKWHIRFSELAIEQAKAMSSPTPSAPVQNSTYDR